MKERFSGDTVPEHVVSSVFQPHTAIKVTGLHFFVFQVVRTHDDVSHTQRNWSGA